MSEVKERLYTHRRVSADSVVRDVEFRLIEDSKDNDLFQIVADSKYRLNFHSKPPKPECWAVYSTHWNTFAAYNDHNNSNKTFELEGYVVIEDTSGEKLSFERQSELINDMVSALFEYAGTEGGRDGLNDLRVSHVRYHEQPVEKDPTGMTEYERCFQKALLPNKQRTWLFF